MQRYWIVDVNDPAIVAFEDPADDAFRSERRYRAGDQVALGPELPGLQLEVAEILHGL